MKKVAITVFIALMVVILGFYLSLFQVKQTESCFVTTFGKPSRQITEPGWYFKWPAPIQRRYTYESQIMELEGLETPTRDALPIIVDLSIVWRIAQPLQFFRAVRNPEKIEDGLLSRLVHEARDNVIGRHYLSELINKDPSKLKFEQIQNEMLTRLQQVVSDRGYGIEIETLSIKQVRVSEEMRKELVRRGELSQ